MTSELRPAVEVWLDAYEASYYDEVDDDQAASAVIEADRKAVRAPLLTEIERLRSALENIVNDCGQCGGYGTYREEETVTGKVLWWDCSSPQCQHARAALAGGGHD